MNKKLLVISGIVIMMLVSSITIPVIAETNDAGIFGRTHLRAIGRNFHICDDDGGLYGHIFIGFEGYKLIFNEDIYIPEESIKLIIMTNHFVNCIYKE
jgi:hypothetical protein